MDYLDSLVSIFSDFVNPRKRVFLGYLALSILIAFVWLLIARRNSMGQALGRIFDRKIFFSGSSKADYKVFVINQIIAMIISPMLLTQIAIATALFFALHEQGFISKGVFEDTNAGLVVALFSAAIFIVDDFTKYLLHRWMHRWPSLWAIHKVHHSATTLTPVTVYRVHPLEGVLFGLRSAIAQGAVLSIFVFLFGDTVDLYTVVGVNVLVFVFHVTGSNLRHSHIGIRYWPWLEHILISPAQHQLHHSIARRHYDKNFGVALAVWDWLFGSLGLSEEDESLEFGLEPGEKGYETGLKGLYLGPLQEIARIAKRRVSAPLKR
ncbi:sterol desaturase family protein [Planktotalea sp.]|uniref:sterol desaturase family protein n=1 Tax=Planktotalea sp. TaxID=2029877 RepID=UPI003299A482